MHVLDQRGLAGAVDSDQGNQASIEAVKVQLDLVHVLALPDPDGAAEAQLAEANMQAFGDRAARGGFPLQLVGLIKD